MNERDYHAHPAIGNSGLKLIGRSPAHYQSSLLIPREDTPSMLQGRALHCAILEPGEFSARYIAAPTDAPRRPTSAQRNAKKPAPESVESIRFWDDFELQAAGRELLTDDMYTSVVRGAHEIRNHPELRNFLREGDAETPIFTTDPKTGVAVKCRPDWICLMGDNMVVIDLKSTEDARPAAFQRTAYNFGYFQQAAFYCDVMEWGPHGQGRPDLWLFAAFERDEPFAVKLYEVGDEEIAFGRAQYRKALDLYAHCVKTGEWPAYDSTIETLSLPTWAKE